MFQNRLEKVFEMIGENQIICLATSSEDRVTARSMSVIVINQKFYFQTDKQFLKYSQIMKNPKVAMSFKNIQIEGICREIGHPMKAENSIFTLKYNQYFKSSFDKYSHMENEVLFEVNPTLISVWDYEDGRPYQEFFDFENSTYSKSYYDNRN